MKAKNIIFVTLGAVATFVAGVYVGYKNHDKIDELAEEAKAKLDEKKNKGQNDVDTVVEAIEEELKK